ncbi:MAG TPA: NAD(P)(+) transhydrogenase (Re/Si-specific) subunit beta, partial [Gemmatimonadales bacterium]
IAVIAAVTDRSIDADAVVWAGLVVGGAAAVWLGRWVSDARLPQFMILVNGLGGGGALLVASLEYAQVVHTGAPNPLILMLPIQLILAVGGITLGAAAMVWARMERRLPKAPLTYRYQRSGNAAAGVLLVVLMLFLTKSPDHPWWCAFAAVLAVGVGALGGLRAPDADLPLVVASLNAATGLAAAAAGLVLGNDGLVAVGGFIGTAAATMALNTSREMGRPLFRVLERALWGAERREMIPPA